MASNDGIYEGPTRQWWGGSSGLGGTGFQKGAQVRLQGLTASAWNGMRGTVEGFDKSKGVLEVEVNGVLKLVKPENCIGDVGTAHSQGPVTPAQMRMQLNAAQLNPTGPPAPAGHQPFSRSSGEPNSRHSRAAGPAVGPAAGPRVDTSQIHKVVARPSRPI
ncbi:Apple domain-containing protein [Durusdinium trenchii]|uniref:Apple domain-containing protein n=2 Tax=Durusdinium trenchii TaxID=1381693 RepID=A0ABP0MQB8_9DINO